MSEPSPFYVARWIADKLREDNFISLRLAIENALHSITYEASEETITDLAEKCEHLVFAELGRIAEQLIHDGTEPSFLLDDEPGTAYIKSQNIEAIKTLERIKLLSPENFELFCAGTLEALGAKASQVVGGKNDGGVDFIAFDMPVSRIEIAALHACYPIVIGQAKRWNDKPISVTDLRSFVGGAIVKADEIKRKYTRYGIFSPIVYAFWTTSDFLPSAREYSVNAGLWCLGGLSLAQLALRISPTLEFMPK
jgi:restriction endonuclease Mrr